MLKALIMAAGRGERLSPVTDYIPKPLIKYKQSTLIENLISQLNSFDVYVTVGYKKNLLSEAVLKHNISGIINTTNQSNVWWIFNSILSIVNEPILVVAGDIITTIPYTELLQDYEKLQQPCCMMVPITPINKVAGDYIKHNNKHITSLSRENITDLYASGIQILNPVKIKKTIGVCDSFDEMWNKLIEHKQLTISSTTLAKWFAVDTIENIKDMENI